MSADYEQRIAAYEAEIEKFKVKIAQCDVMHTRYMELLNNYKRLEANLQKLRDDYRAKNDRLDDCETEFEILKGKYKGQRSEDLEQRKRRIHELAEESVGEQQSSSSSSSGLSTSNSVTPRIAFAPGTTQTFKTLGNLKPLPKRSGTVAGTPTSSSLSAARSLSSSSTNRQTVASSSLSTSTHPGGGPFVFQTASSSQNPFAPSNSSGAPPLRIKTL